MSQVDTSWVEIDREALAANARAFLGLCGAGTRLLAVVKANAYGHGLVESAKVFLQAGASWLGVNSLLEARTLREAGLRAPIYIMGHVLPETFPELVTLGDCRLVVYRRDVLEALSREAVKAGRPPVPVHLKLETGNNRQGVGPEEALGLAAAAKALPGVVLEGISSHYADIEDTTDHSFARQQLAAFIETDRVMRDAELGAPIRHFSNSAAAMLWPETRFELIRPGISLYGMWPSKETYVSALVHGVRPLNLRPALTWKARIAQVKTVPAGQFVGYGRSFRTTHDSRIAVLPVGYYEGYDRSLGNSAGVLVEGRFAPVRGRVCMNMVMVDVTDIPEAREGGVAVLLGESRGPDGGVQRISAENLAEWAGTINYEVTTRINEQIPRVFL
jgi:alanine racemase